MASKIDVESGNPYRDPNTGLFGTSPDAKLAEAFSKTRGVKFVTHEDNQKKIKQAKKEAEAKLKSLRSSPSSNGLMSEEEAINATKNSALKGIKYYHGTSQDNAESISKDGFKVGSGRNRFGVGVYLTDDGTEAETYADKDSPALTVSYINAKKVFKEPVETKDGDGSIESKVAAKFEGKDPDTVDWSDYVAAYKTVTDELFTEGYDAILIPEQLGVPSQIVIKDPSIIKTFYAGDPKKVSEK